MVDSSSNVQLGKQAEPGKQTQVAASSDKLKIGALIAAPTIRLRGVYFALFTIGLAEVGRAIVKQHETLGKSEGLFGGARFLNETQGSTETGRTIEFFVGLALIVFCLVLYRVIDSGRLGLLLRTARESEGVAKGLGEGGTISPPAAIGNAVEDALRPFGVEVRDAPLTPERILSLIDAARASGAPT